MSDLNISRAINGFIVSDGKNQRVFQHADDMFDFIKDHFKLCPEKPMPDLSSALSIKTDEEFLREIQGR